jgi:hypothetical protein
MALDLKTVADRSLTDLRHWRVSVGSIVTGPVGCDAAESALASCGTDIAFLRGCGGPTNAKPLHPVD